jgi:hypothetical protein
MGSKDKILLGIYQIDTRFIFPKGLIAGIGVIMSESFHAVAQG